MNDVLRAKRLLESKGYNVKKQVLFERIEESTVIPLEEFIDIHGNEYAWEDTLDEEVSIKDKLSGDQLKEYGIGDIIMPSQIYSRASHKDVDPHKILLIHAKKEEDSGIIHYQGFLLSSKAIEKANKYNPRYPNNIYIADYANILYKGKIEHKEAFIRVDDVIQFTNKDLSVSGSWKGKASFKFLRFINNCYDNYLNGISNEHRYWIAERSYNNG